MMLPLLATAWSMDLTGHAVMLLHFYHCSLTYFAIKTSFGEMFLLHQTHVLLTLLFFSIAFLQSSRKAHILLLMMLNRY